MPAPAAHILGPFSFIRRHKVQFCDLPKRNVWSGCCIWFLGFVNSVWWSSIIHSFLKIAAHFGSTNDRVLHHCRICLIGSLKVENIRLFSVGVLYQTFLTPSQEWRLDEVSQNPKALQPHAAPFSISTLLLQSPCPPIQVPTLKLQGEMVSSSCPCPGTLSFHQEPQGPVLTCPSICSFVPNEILCFNLRQWVLICCETRPAAYQCLFWNWP